MLNLKKLQTSAALALTLGMTSTGLAPIVMMGSATATPPPIKLAQLFPSQPRSTTPTDESYGSYRIPENTSLPVSYDKAEKIVIAPNETLAVTLTIPSNIRSSNRALLIPAGSKIEGEFQPADGGTQFVSKTLVFPNGQKIPIDAVSNVATRTEEIRRGVSTDAILKGAAIGAGAATILSGVTGNRRITLGKVLIGGGAGALGGLVFGRNRAQVIVVNPREDLDLRLNTPLSLNAY